MIKKFYLPVLLILIISQSCKKKTDTLFQLQNNDKIGVNFINQLEDKKGANVFSYRNYYNGGGVAIGDVNNDGLNDVYLTSNQGDNQLYINKGNWQFENVTEKAGVKGDKYWSTGVTMVDINADGWLDIYVCNSGNAKGSETENELFVNQHNGTFKEEAEKYGLADRGLSTHAVFFDYDLDGDLDCYILNNSFRPIESFDFAQNLRDVVDELGGDRLYRNDNGHFTNVTKNAGIYSSDIGFGLGVSVADINEDGYPDIYVSNDFFERDYLYLNQKNGTFREVIQDETGHLSLASMGSDIADVNNDGKLDIFTTEMLPEGDKRLKQVTSFESYDVVKLKQKDGYYNQYMQNCLQINNGDGSFSETAFYSGVAATDWSWGALMFDMDNDGWKDILVCNGIYKDLTDQDYIEFLGSRENMEKIAQGKKFDPSDFISKMKSTPISNYAFLNKHNLKFSNETEKLGLDEPSFSNGAAYGDLDNDGDLDLVINNVNMPVFFYKNTLAKKEHHAILVKLKGDSLNRFGVGTTVKAFNDGKYVVYYHQPSRGFQSSTSPNELTVGVGNHKRIDSLQVIWPKGNYETLKNLKTDQTYTFDVSKAKKIYSYTVIPPAVKFRDCISELFDSIPTHKENDFIDFDRERLMLQMLSTENPYMAPGDINGDGLQDFYFGSSKDNPAAIYIQQKNGKFRQYIPEDFKKQVYMEWAGAAFGDFDKDGDDDLIISAGGNDEQAGNDVFFPRFFENDGKGHLKNNPQKLIRFSVNASQLIACDYDHDGDLDLFLGGRSIPGVYGSSPNSYLLQNDGKGNFANVSKDIFGTNNKLGMVTSAKWADLDNNGFEDLIVTGNWMGVKIFMNQKGRFTENTQLNNYKGLWTALEIGDINHDGKPDIIAGNLGLNTKFYASETEPMKIYVKDFDENGTKECVTSMFKNDHVSYVFHMKPDLVGQMPMFKKRFLKYENYAGTPFNEVFPNELLEGAETHEINYLQSAVFINEGNGRFSCRALPYQAQLSCINTVLFDDFNKDGSNEILVAGNFSNFKPEVGRLDASYGQIFAWKNGNFSYYRPAESGIKLKGDVRSSLLIKNARGIPYYLFGINNSQIKAFKRN
ncbi:hypothetical protein GS399_19670 [Pedobacter sp. HMF7647]|uniref:ASPIC/UnbV domain-containing protein n=1 Tax=Hufsiella arboris TaxID=2695275 RepID=A0A7K1YFK9_9SPHI|nr:VCBS repeat-containing protein [Hufsiella arboris]MXV53191.1 hypothetical protein [Hufsiella arboris]